MVLAQNRSKNNPTSKLIQGPDWVTRSVTAMTVWMTLSLGGAGGRGQVTGPGLRTTVVGALDVEAPGA